MRIALLLLVMFMLPFTASAADVPPSVTITPAPLKTDMQKVRKALAATSGLNIAEKKKLIGEIRKQLPKKPDVEKQAERKATIMRWQALTDDERKERQAKAAAKWSAQTAMEKEYQRGLIIERLRAMSTADRNAVLGSFQSPPPVTGEKK